MLTCKEQVALSSDFLDKELSFRQRSMMWNHFIFCSDCRRFIGQMRLMQKTLRATAEDVLPDAASLGERLAAEHRRPKIDSH